MGLMRTTAAYLDVYRDARVMCVRSVSLCLSSPSVHCLPLCNMYHVHVPNNDRYEQDSLQKGTWFLPERELQPLTRP